MVDKDNIESISGLAAMQKGMFFNYAVDSASDAYVEQFDFTGTGEMNAGHMRTALAALSRHYSVLRSVFSFRNTDDPYQVVLKEWAPALDLLDLTGSPDTERAVADFKTADRARGFDLSKDVLLRATLIETGGERWHFVFTFHHIILDGWSLGPLFGTLFGYYDELVRTGSLQQRRETRPYRDYFAWYERQRGADAHRYWADELDGYERAAVLPTSRSGDGYRPATHRFTLPDTLHDGLKRLAQRTEVTQNAVFQAAWGVVLQKFNYTDDVVFGSVVSGRGVELDGIEDMVGLFVNTQPVRVTTGDGTDFTDLCRSVRDAYRRASPYQYYPLYEVQGATRLKNDLLNHVLAFENYPLSEQLQSFGADDEGLRFTGVEVFERTDYDFNVVVNPGASFHVTFTYNADLYPSALMEALESGLVRVLAAAVADPHTPVRNIAIGDPGIHPAPAVSPDSAAFLDSSLVEVFDGIVRTHGDRTAVVHQGRAYTYREIDRWSDAVAGRLKDLGIAPGTGVGVLADRRPELIVAMLGLMKNGSHYVPVDTKDATPRIEYVLADAGVRHLATVAAFTGQAPASAELLVIDEPDGEVPAFPRHRGGSDAVAYVMYTSGSTGNPKGCSITHRNVLRLFTGQDFFDYGDGQTVVMTSSPAFDACTFEIWGTLLFGGTLVLPDEVDILDGGRLHALITEHRPQALWLTTPLFQQLAEGDPGMFAPLRQLLIGGSVLSIQHTEKVLDACPGLRITNFYGPTENTVFSTAHPIRREDLRRDRVPIGRVLNHTTAHVLDNGLNPLPPGAIGELCLGGAGVSPGYHQRPELNREKFVTVPQLPGERLYRTGDLTRQWPDGTLDYIGRTDDQVKISGFRVELGEVQALLRSVDRIIDAVVIAVDENGVKSLRGYYLATGELPAQVVREALATQVAGYLIPATLIQVDTFPLNKSGKVDLHRLAEQGAAPRTATAVESRTAAAPQAPARQLSAMERTLLDIAMDILPGVDIDIDRNFFDTGINSLNLVAISNRLRKALGREVPLPLFFEYTTISSLAAWLEAPAGSAEEEPDGPTEEEEEEEQAAFRAGALLRHFGDDDSDGDGGFGDFGDGYDDDADDEEGHDDRV
ncbi:amino acid adenylation domain-containing protein [Streptomyces sp. NPDC000594]|uniref:non-ribosomal peptide synthetase n=1 Tax=Streptomyces sp. NPDC000594 TaxID=3154261 RepID=UPI0033316440